MSSLNEKRNKNKSGNSAEFSSLVLPNSFEREKNSIPHQNLEAQHTIDTQLSTPETPSDQHKELDLSQSSVSLENIFPIDPEVVHRAHMDLEAEQYAKHHQPSHVAKNSLPSFFFLWNGESYLNFWRFFWREFNQNMSKKKAA